MSAQFLVEKVLRIKPESRPESRDTRVTRGESIRSNYSTTAFYVEEEPTSAGWVASYWPNRQETFQYIRNLFPL